MSWKKSENNWATYYKTAKMKIKLHYFPRLSVYVFLLLLLALSLLYGYQHTGKMLPASIHQWRQADCYSIASNYYHEGMKFFKPSMHFIGESETGYVAAEFPIVYYTVAGLWKVFGQKVWIFRMINILIVFAGLLALFKFTEKLLKDSVWALMTTLLLFTSPILIFYTNNFIADAPAFGLSLIGLYFFYSFYQSKSLKMLYIACVFFLFGALLKVTAALLFIAIAGVFVFEQLSLIKTKNNEKLFDKPLKHALPLLMVFMLAFTWYFYAAAFNNKYNGEYFLLGVLPIWDMKYPHIIQISRALNENLVYQFFNVYTLVITLCMFALLLIKWEVAHRFFKWALLFIFGGSVAYLLLFYKVFDVHDYYLLNLLIFMALVPPVFLKLIKDAHASFFNNHRVKIAFLLLLLFNVYYAFQKNSIKYTAKQEVWQYSFLNRSDEADYWRWFHWHYNTYIKAYETITPYLRSLGIERTDRVISINDHSPNISLALMDVKGVTDFGKSILTAERMQYEIDRGAKYLIVNKPEMLEQEFLQDFIKYPMGNYHNISIFDLRFLTKYVSE